MHTLDANDFALLIDGQLRGGARRVPVINPSTGDVLVEGPSASPEQLQDAINAAQRAYTHWKRAPMEMRRATVNKIADLMADHQEELSRLLMLEAGKPMPAARAEVRATIGYFRHFATLELSDEIIEDSDTRHVRIVREPLGVVAAIVAWNFPLLLLAFKLPPALLAGNAIVVKPATTTPLATLHLGRLIADHLPAGLINVLAGDDDLGPQMTAHPGFRKISFTGSTATGRRVMSSAAAHLTRVTLELGGNDPAIVLDDVDVEHAAKGIFAAAFGHSGQVCRAIKRVYAHEKIHDALAHELARLATEVKVARADQDEAEMGPVQNLAQYRRLQELLDEARTLGTVIGSASIPSGPGYFIPPTIVTNMPSRSRLVAEEQFGPILPVLSFSTLQQAIDLANDSPYGLGASVWARDPALAQEVATALEAGTVMVNKHVDRTPHLPMAGAKQSGVGVELGLHGLHEFTQLKVINTARGA